MLTGKAIYTAWCASWPHNKGQHPDWEHQGEDVQATYAGIADRLNTQFITPLQGVIAGYQTLVEQMNKRLYEHAGDSETLDQRIERLEKEANALLREEESHP